MNQKLIEALKKNEKPFILLPKEIREFIKSHGKEALICIQAGSKPDNIEWGMSGAEETVGSYDECEYLYDVYRLRPDYEPEPEIRECEIRECEIRECEIYESDGQDGLKVLCYDYSPDSKEWRLETACKHPNFIGFKFESGAVQSTPVRYNVTYIKGNVLDDRKGYERLINGNSKECHATHVLFRRAK